MYKKLFARELTLLLSQIWYRGEVIDHQGWTEQKKPGYPYLVFEKTSEVTNVYINEEGMEDVGKELRAKVMNDPGFVQYVIDTYYDSIKDIRGIWEEEQTLSQEDLLVFIKKFQKSWPWFDAIYWLCEILDDLNDNRFDSVMDVRKDVEML